MKVLQLLMLVSLALLVYFGISNKQAFLESKFEIEDYNERFIFTHGDGNGSFNEYHEKMDLYYDNLPSRTEEYLLLHKLEYTVLFSCFVLMGMFIVRLKELSIPKKNKIFLSIPLLFFIVPFLHQFLFLQMNPNELFKFFILPFITILVFFVSIQKFKDLLWVLLTLVLLLTPLTIEKYQKDRINDLFYIEVL